MATRIDDMSVVDIIRRSMAESFGYNKRKLDKEESTQSSNKRLHVEKNEVEIKSEIDCFLHIDDSYFESFDDPIRIKENPAKVLNDDDLLEHKIMLIKEEVLSPMSSDHDDDDDDCQQKWNISISEYDQAQPENETQDTDSAIKNVPIEADKVLPAQNPDDDLTILKQSETKTEQIDSQNQTYETHMNLTQKQPSTCLKRLQIKVLHNDKVDNVLLPETTTKKEDDSSIKPYILNITFLQALYLRCHEEGIAFIEELTTDYLADVEVESIGLIKLRESRFRNKILKHLHGAKVISVPSKGQNLGKFLDVVLNELSKGCTVQDLRDLLQKLKISNDNKHAHYQTVNMKIFGFFQWEYGHQFINTLKSIPTLASDATIGKSIIDSIEESLQYLIENERPLKLYGDIIESIYSQKSNFLDSASINAMNLFNITANNTYLRKIVIDDFKHDYFINSLTAKLMIARWKSKLKVGIEDIGDDTLLCLEGCEVDVHRAHEEFRTQIAEGPMLPFGTLQVYSFVRFLLDKIKSIQRHLDTFDADKAVSDIMELENEPRSAKRDQKISYKYEDLHTYIFATRGLQQGKEKLFVLHEFISSYRLSLMRDDLKQGEWKMIQDAFVVLQFKKSNRATNYRYFLKCLNSMKHAEAIILTLEEYKILSETIAGKSIIDVIGKVVDFDVTFSRIFSSKHATLTIIGTESGILTCKNKLYEFLDRVTISECNIADLENKLNTALEKLWTTTITKENALNIFKRIQILTSNNEIHMIETVRKLYMHLHIYLFGRCRLLNGQIHVSKLRVYHQYLKSEKSTSPEILNDIISSYEMLFGKIKKQFNYKDLLDKSSNEVQDLNSQRDINTVCICDAVVRAHFYNNAIARSLLKNYIDESNLPKLVFTAKQFVNSKLIILSSATANDRKLPIIIKSESVRIFSQKRSQILEDLTVSLQAIAEVKENMTHIKGSDIFKEIQYLERNSATASVIKIKYQILNIYLFGCCGFYEGHVHLEVLKDNHIKISGFQDDDQDDVITDKNTRASLVNAYEFIFWKGKKDSVDYDFLLHKAGIVCNNNIQTLSLSIEMYGYLTHVREGMHFLEKCATSVKIEVQKDSVNKACFVSIEGDELEVQKVVDMLIKETKCIKVYFNIPFYKENLIKYIKKKLKELYIFDSLEVPVHIMLHLEILERLLQTSLSESDCSQILHLRSMYYITLHKYIFAVFEAGESTKHIAALKKIVADLTTYNSEKYLEINTIQSVHNIINNYLFAANKILDLDYKRILKECIKSRKILNIHIALSKHVGEYLNNCNDGTDSTKLLQEHMETITKTISINAYDEHFDKIRDYINEYTIVLKNIPMLRNDLIKRIKLLFTRISDSKHRDPKTIWTSIQICKRQDSKFAVDRLPLTYSRLHMHLFGYRQLLKGKQLVQCLGQHEYNLEMIRKPEQIVSIQILKDIFIALQYIEGTTDKGVDYKALVSKINKNHKISNNKRSSRHADIPNKRFIMSSEVKAPQPQREYVQNTGTGRALINSIQNSFVHIKFDSDFLKLRGSDADVKLATYRLNDYFTMVYALPVHEHQMRFAIASYMRKLRNNKVEIGHIASLYTEIFKIELKNIDSSRKVNKTLLNGHYHTLHINLFGCLKLLDGEKHVTFLKTFNDGKVFLNESGKRKLYEAYDYIFGSTKKDIDYNIIIRDLCGNRCFHVSKALERLLEIQNRLKKGKDSFIGPSSIASVENWISFIKEDMFNDEIIIAAHTFLNKYEDIRDNKKDVTLI